MFTPKNIRTTYLPNGLAILTERMEHTRCVSMGVWLKTGARHDAWHDLTVCSAHRLGQ